MKVQIGICSWDGSPTTRAVIEKMSRQLKYPADSKSVFLDSPIAIGALGSNEPYQSKTGNLIGLDGRLDNRGDLLHRLSQRVRGDSDDIAFVAAAFEAWGPECFSKFVGEWAIAIWELRTRTLFLARDYIGTKHLFYR